MKLKYCQTTAEYVRRLRRIARKLRHREWIEREYSKVTNPTSPKNGEIVQIDQIFGEVILTIKRSGRRAILLPEQKVWLHRVSNKLARIGNLHTSIGHAIYMDDGENEWFYFPGKGRGVKVVSLQDMPLHTAMTLVGNFDNEHKPSAPQTARRLRRDLCFAKLAKTGHRHERQLPRTASRF